MDNNSDQRSPLYKRGDLVCYKDRGAGYVVVNRSAVAGVWHYDLASGVERMDGVPEDDLRVPDGDRRWSPVKRWVDENEIQPDPEIEPWLLGSIE